MGLYCAPSPVGARLLDPVLGRLGALEVRLASGEAEIGLAQRLRYHVFYEEMSAQPSRSARLERRDIDPYGRSCVLKPYRNKRTVELLWHGIWAYVLHHRVDVMFGCASLEGTDPKELAVPLSFLHHHARAPEPWRVRAVPERFAPMDLLPQEAVDTKTALHALPPLIKGYLRLGATFGDGAVVDGKFGTTDVLVILPVSAINPRYIAHFGREADRHAA
jgi:putative hemolysin